MVGVEVDTLGRLLNFWAKSPAVEEPAKSGSSPDAPPQPPAPDWKILFTLAGLDMSRFTPADPQWNPESICDARAAWTGTWAELPDVALRVEAASYHGKFVFFRLIYPWTKPPVPGASRDWAVLVQSIFFAVPLLGAALLARHNYKHGKGDRRGAFKLACLAFVSQMLSWLFTARHVLASEELDLLGQGISSALLFSAAIWVLYLALEPYVRRRWPTSLITWSRVLERKPTDPLVGRDVLIGMVAGIGLNLISLIRDLGTDKPALNVDLSVLLGLRYVLGNLASSLSYPLMIALFVIFLLTLLRALLRRDWLAAAVVVLIFSVLSAFGDYSALSLALGLVLFSSLIFVFLRFGLLAIAIALFTPLGGLLPLTTNLSTWHAGITLFVFGIVLALAAFAFRTSLGGKKVFEGKLLED
jgi:serine/threonine-protein kinase